MSNLSATVELLGKSRLFGALNEQDRHAVAQQMREVRYPQGKLIFSRGDPGRDIYLVLEGRVRLSVLTPEGRELSFTHAGPGDVFGEIATFDGGSRTADATTVSPVQAMTLNATALKRLIETNPHVAEAAIAFLCARLREADEQLEVIALHPIEVRLARFFLAAVKTRDGDAADEAEKATIEIGLSQGELALRIGASRPKVNLALTTLEEMGAIERSGNRFTCHLDTLRDLAERE